MAVTVADERKAAPVAMPVADAPYCLGNWLVEPRSKRISLLDQPLADQAPAGQNPASQKKYSRSVEPRLMQLLCLLAASPGEVLGRDELMAELWPDVFVNENSLTRAVSQLRKLLSDPAAGASGRDFIETIPKTGYRLTAAVRPAPGPMPKQGGEQEGQEVTRTDESLQPQRETGAMPGAGATAVFRVAARLGAAALVLGAGIFLGQLSTPADPGFSRFEKAPLESVLPAGEAVPTHEPSPELRGPTASDSTLAALGDVERPSMRNRSGSVSAEPLLLQPSLDDSLSARPVISHDGSLLAYVSYEDNASSVLLGSTRVPAAPLKLYRSEELIYNLQWSPLDNALIFAQRPHYRNTAGTGEAEAELILFSLDSMSAMVIDSSNGDWRREGYRQLYEELQPPKDKAKTGDLNLT